MSGRGEALLARIGELEASGDIELRCDEPMSRHTTLRLGGPADVWARPTTVRGLAELLRRTHVAGIAVTFFGGGTNVIVRDGGIRGVVINIGRLNAVTRPDPEHAPGLVEVETGASTGKVLRHAIGWNLGGVEFLGGVPGSVGGGLVMNAGTYLGEFTDVVVQVRSLTRDGSAVVRDHDACGFRYRDSDLPRDEVVVMTTLQLHQRDPEKIAADVASLKKRRREREPHGVPNNGSTFKNPPGDYAGRLIEVAGLKGTRVGGAIVSPVHANWLVVDPSLEPPCTSADMLELIALVQTRIREQHQVSLDLEVRVIGEP